MLAQTRPAASLNACCPDWGCIGPAYCEDLGTSDRRTHAQPDGNCLYRAVEDQLRLSDPGAAAGAAVPSHAELRRKAVAHMREHQDEFLPFFAQVRRITLGGA